MHHDGHLSRISCKGVLNTVVLWRSDWLLLVSVKYSFYWWLTSLFVYTCTVFTRANHWNWTWATWIQLVKIIRSHSSQPICILPFQNKRKSITKFSNFIFLPTLSYVPLPYLVFVSSIIILRVPSPPVFYSLPKLISSLPFTVITFIFLLPIHHISFRFSALACPIQNPISLQWAL